MNLIFDLDGTLVDSAAGIHAALEETMRQMYPEIDPKTLNFVIGPPLPEVLTKAFAGWNKQDLKRIEAVFSKVYAEQGWQTATLYPNVKETLEQLNRQGIRNFLVTNKSTLPTSRILSNLNLDIYFTDVACPDSRTPYFTHKSGSLQFLIDKNSLSKEDSIYIGDSQDDLLTARMCGMDFIGVRYGYGNFEESPASIPLVSSFAELPRMMQESFEHGPR